MATKMGLAGNFLGGAFFLKKIPSPTMFNVILFINAVSLAPYCSLYHMKLIGSLYHMLLIGSLYHMLLIGSLYHMKLIGSLYHMILFINTINLIMIELHVDSTFCLQPFTSLYHMILIGLIRHH